jgi:hypothetical protein
VTPGNRADDRGHRSGGAPTSYRRLVVGGGRAPGFPSAAPGDLSLNVNPASVPDVLGTIAQAPFRAEAFPSLYVERVPFMSFTGRHASALVEAARILQAGGRLVIETGIYAPERAIIDTLHTTGFADIVVERAGLLRITARRGGS